MKAIITLLLINLLTLGTLNAAVIKSFNQSRECTRFSIKDERPGEGLKLESNESIHIKGPVYGFTLQDLSVDFDNRWASAKVIILKYGANKVLNKSITIKKINPQFNAAINQVNKKILTMHEICIDNNGELIDFKAVR